MKNKTIALISTFFISASLASAELHKPSRIVELDFETNMGASNNYFSANEVLVKDLVIDLTQMAEELTGKGFILEYGIRENNAINVNANEKFRLGLFAGVTGNGNINIGNGLFDFLGKGFTANQTKSIELNAYADMYLDAGISFRTKIKEFGVKISPAYYVPLLYVPNPEGKFTLSSKETGKLTADASADLRVYTAFNLDGGDIQADIMNSLSNGGFDISFEVERPILGKLLEGGVYGRIPVLPGKLNYEMSRTVTAHANTSENGIFDFLNDNKPEFEYDFGEATYSEVTQKFHRPLRFGVEAMIRPLSKDWFVIQPTLGFALRTPFSSEIKFYPEFTIPVSLRLKQFLDFTLTTGYLDKVFFNQADFKFNARAIELDFGIGFRSPSFLRSFTPAGATFSFGLKMGW